jgi:hypothetical protein
MPAVQNEIERCILDGCRCGNERLEWETVEESQTWREPSGTLMRTSDQPLRMAVCRGDTHYWIPRTRATA